MTVEYPRPRAEDLTNGTKEGPKPPCPRCGAGMGVMRYITSVNPKTGFSHRSRELGCISCGYVEEVRMW